MPGAPEPPRDTATALRDSELRLRLAVRAAGIGIWDWNVLTNDMVWSDEAKRIGGLPVALPVTFEQIRALTHPEDLPHTSAMARRALDPQTHETEPYEYRLVRPDGGIRWVLAHGEAVFEEIDGVPRAVRYVGTLRDITGRKAAEERHRFLMREIVHRVRNTLAGVRAIATSTLRNARSLKEAEAVLSARINALANVHTLLGGGHDGLTGLDEIVATVVAPYRDGPDRIRLSGPPVALAERDALALAIAVHELVANAATHGSLSAATGTVAVDWTVAPAAEGSDLRLTWREAGGPPVEPPRHRGLGTRLIEQAFGGPANARVELSFLPEGVVCAIQARLSGTPPPAAAAGS